ncbi:Potassium/sodium hyperpolarization-activated cyclic nucleotide-gated channel 2 [Symbiodinium microadriaticum]|uniref:Potassium/sodium hyperpolarization-activated cyclic nucleotide-gated channel 2 n=1 Tax=Symbiodinium microadriaticum TaxID=2951 RepID=A0A1Q9EMD7_SYMMI|nr:Potassium/sodium hyperpolarization-activated cyclic nucleotide-gated channel 2 [Symbiodinium microadriaticum]
MADLSGNVHEYVPAGRGHFWELHRQLAECYTSDMAACEGRRRNSFNRQGSAGFSDRGGLVISSAMAVPELSPPSPQSSHNLAPLRPGVGPPSVDRLERNRAPTGNSKGKTLRTLLDVQGVDLPEDASVADLDLKMHTCWADWTGSKNLHHAATRSRRVTSKSASAHDGDIETDLNSTLLSRCVVHPGGAFKTFWNFIVAVGVFYDMIVIPLGAFNMPNSDFIDVMDTLFQLFWNADFVLAFLTGYYEKGTLILKPWRTACHYVKTWMLFDLGLISMDWAFFVIDLQSNGAEDDWSRALRMLRFLRLLRIVRAVKLRRAHEALQDLLHSQAASLYLSLCSSLMYLMVLNHLIACAWFGVSWLNTRNWVLDAALHEEDATFQYLYSMNWAFAQLGVGSSSAKPQNSLETAFCVLIAFRSLMTSAPRADENTEFRLLRAYLAHHNIPQESRQKVTQFLQHQYALKTQDRSDGILDVPPYATSE